MEKYLMEEREYEGITYHVLPAKALKKMFEQWQCHLDKKEKRLLKKYRRRLMIKGNLNEKIRKGEKSENIEIISKAILKARLEENIVVYRRIGKREKADIQKQLKDGDGKRLYFKDFKGTHAWKNIRNFWSGAGHIIFLIPEGSPVAYINNTSIVFRWEKELLIDKGQEYVLIGKEDIFKKETYIVKLDLKHNSSKI